MPVPSMAWTTVRCRVLGAVSGLATGVAEDVPLEVRLVQVHSSNRANVIDIVLHGIGIGINALIERGFVELAKETTHWCTFKSHDMQTVAITREQGPRDKRVKTDQTPKQMPKI